MRNHDQASENKTLESQEKRTVLFFLTVYTSILSSIHNLHAILQFPKIIGG